MSLEQAALGLANEPEARRCPLCNEVLRLYAYVSVTQEVCPNKHYYHNLRGRSQGKVKWLVENIWRTTTYNEANKGLVRKPSPFDRNAPRLSLPSSTFESDPQKP